ncbi:MAG: glycosyltransferase, partial [Corynebacterium sp.]|nr:glycosyltransferase [Corynebacterium sp.]
FVVPRRDVEVCRKVTPLKPLQAVACGVPVIGTDLPALKEITGGLMVEVEPDNPSALAKSVDLVRQGELIVNPRELEEWAKKRSWERNAHSLEGLYLELLRGR